MTQASSQGVEVEVTPERQLIGSRAELATSIDRLLALRPRQLRIAAADGSHFQLDAGRVVDAIAALLVADRAAGVRILVDDARWIETRAPRLKQVHRQFPHALQLRAAATDDSVGDDLHVLADDAHCINVRAGKLVSGDLWLNNRSRARPLVAVFDRRWATAAHNLPVAPLGL